MSASSLEPGVLPAKPCLSICALVCSTQHDVKLRRTARSILSPFPLCLAPATLLAMLSSEYLQPMLVLLIEATAYTSLLVAIVLALLHFSNSS